MILDYEYESLAKNIVKSLRGDKSQAWVNKKLGYTGNYIYRLEKGYKVVTWSDFLNLCEAFGKNIEQAINNSDHLKDFSEYKNGGLVLETLIGEFPLEKACEILEQNTRTIKRWSRDGHDVPLHIVLKAFGMISTDLINFLEPLVDLTTLPEVKETYERYEKERKFLVEHPFGAVLKEAIVLKEYLSLKKHSDEFLAKKLNLPLQETSKIISDLLDLGVLEYFDKAPYEGLLARNPVYMNTKRLKPSEAKKIVTHWAQYAVEYFKKNYEFRNRNEACGYLIYCSTPESDKEIMDAYFQFYNKVREINNKYNKEGGTDSIRLLNVNLLPLAKSFPENNNS